MAVAFRSVLVSNGISVDSIEITTMPTKTSYYSNEPIDITGMVVTAKADLMTGNVADSCTITPNTATTIGEEEIVVSYKDKTDSFNITVEKNPLTITSMPTRTSYYEGETLDLTGLVITHDDYGDVTSECTFNPVNGTILSDSGTKMIVATYDGITISFDVSVSVISTLEEADWEIIQAVGSKNIGSQYWSIGDTKTVTLNGNIGSYLTLNNFKCKVFIINFGYGNQNGIYFQGFKTLENIDIALVDSQYNNKGNNKSFGWYHWWSGTYANVFGGWSGCDLRYDILGSTDVAPSGYGSAVASGRTGYDATLTCATNPVANTLMASLPSDLRAVLAPWTIYTHNNPAGTGATRNTSESVTPTIDYLPLLAQYEVTGTYSSSGNNANQYEHNYQYQITYYKNGNSKLKNKSNNTSEGAIWWLRSPRINATTSIMYINNDGTLSYSASKSAGLAPAFRVA